MVFEGIAQPVESDMLQPLPVDGDFLGAERCLPRCQELPYF